MSSTARRSSARTIEAICALKVPAAADCVLFLWATAPMLPQALKGRRRKMKICPLHRLRTHGRVRSRAHLGPFGARSNASDCAFSWPQWISAHMRSHRGTASDGPFGSPVFAHEPGRPNLHLALSSRRLGRWVVKSRANDHATLNLLASKTRPQARTLQATRASLWQARSPARCGCLSSARWRHIASKHFRAALRHTSIRDGDRILL
jgi:hypothetical protein